MNQCHTLEMMMRAIDIYFHAPDPPGHQAALEKERMVAYFKAGEMLYSLHMYITKELKRAVQYLYSQHISNFDTEK